jgi:uncharacterized coiled-coil protein SlyX
MNAQTEHMTRRGGRLATCAALAVSAGLVALAGQTGALAQKSSSGSTTQAQIDALKARLDTLEPKVATLETKVAALESQNAAQERRLDGLASMDNYRGTQIADLAYADLVLGNRATQLETKLAPVTLSGKNFLIEGVNVHIRDGSGSTGSGAWNGGSLSGLGNLIIGYNESRSLEGKPDNRTGSHNLVLGILNDYSSYGGIVAGHTSSISKPYATVTGGYGNSASEIYASVSGGFKNNAAGLASSISGGDSNVATGNRASVSGGTYRRADDWFDWAAGGLFQDR